MDDLERADVEIGFHIQEAMNTKRKYLVAHGFCFNCNEECDGCFCDEGCSEDYHHRCLADKRNGVN